jgi:hypothetical protein
MTALTLEQRRAQRRAAIVAPPPPIQHRQAPAAPVEAPKAPVWEPEDPVFFHRAVCLVAASLKPATLADDDKQKADALARTIARALCGGGFPDGYVTMKNQMVVTHQIKPSEELTAADRPGSRTTMSEGEKGKIRARLEKYASLGPIPSRAELAEFNRADLADLSHLSEGVRAVALEAICLHLCQRPDITGARQDDAFNCVVEAIEHSLSVAESLGLPTGEIDEGEVIGPARFPYPASLVVEYMADALANAQDETEETEDQESAS